MYVVSFRFAGSVPGVGNFTINGALVSPVAVPPKSIIRVRQKDRPSDQILVTVIDSRLTTRPDNEFKWTRV